MSSPAQSNRWRNWDCRSIPSAANADKVVDETWVPLWRRRSSITCRRSKWPRRSCGRRRRRWAGQSFDRGHPYNQPSVVQAQKGSGTGRVEFELYRAPRADRRIRQRPFGESRQPGASRPSADVGVSAATTCGSTRISRKGSSIGLRIGQSVDRLCRCLSRARVSRAGGRLQRGHRARRCRCLPPENATGNFVKVVQRLPVRIELTGPAPQDTPLFVGLSVEPEVDLKTDPRGADAGSRLRGPLGTNRGA